MNCTIVWFRRDLRIADHAPLYRAALRGSVIPVFVFDRALLHHPETAVSRVAFMLECLRSLDQDLRDRGGRLILRSGDPVDVLPALIQETQAEGIYAHIDFERIYGRVRDARLNQKLAEQNLKIRWFEPSATTPELIPYPQYRDLWYADMGADPVPVPGRVQVPSEVISEPLPTLAELGLNSDNKPIPPGGTQAARQLLQEFLMEKSDRYYWQLSYPSAEATTGLSPHIKFGAISIRECFQTARRLERSPDQRIQRSCKQLISRLRWGNGFAQRFRYLPQLELRSLYSVFDTEGWGFDETLYQAWQQGQTGFPIVDAAARCLQATGGWKELNFRSRALYASFLSNLLGMDWRFGALHFMRHLIDGDCPIDHYQWAMQAGVTHCVDKTWTRIYNPEQSAVDRCDPEGAFIKRWIPELKNLPPECLGSPPPINGYPAPILNYKKARRQRVQQLEQQRQRFLNQENIVPFLSRLPENLLPFGSDLISSEVGWAQTPDLSLFPSPLDLDSLDLEQAKALRTWFVAHVDIPPRKTSRRKPKSVSEDIQLSLL
ncbi:DNA photolyase family protein [Kovacikia minuta CCNUW1]|uniref:FAD-binding domain-containing protein n=1 Tax=Kovacikia minuta TaxID=2931930 RepID=UPI001CCBF12A|nr:deoxyribodipyrimidine photo-lyase [Kovacikia minuta]UBF24149.1 DNA photolyase family protein [Kovacikia minuta CCNUW1]